MVINHGVLHIGLANPSAGALAFSQVMAISSGAPAALGLRYPPVL
jgi:hypothetical protein